MAATEDGKPVEESASLIEVEISLMSGEELAVLSVPDTCLISELKLQLEKRQGIPHQQAQLIIPGLFSKLDDHTPISDCSLSDGKLPLILVRNAGFWPSARFDGSKEGYVFTCGDQGVGYYLDSYEEWLSRSPGDPWDGFWDGGNGTTIVIERGTIFWGAVTTKMKGIVSTIVDKGTTTFETEVPDFSARFCGTLHGPDDLRFNSEAYTMGAIPLNWTRTRG